MVIGARIRELRKSKRLSQGDIEKRTGLLRCYLSRVENGHTVPSLETIQKLAGAFEMPLYHFFYEGNKPPKMNSAITRAAAVPLNGNSRDTKYIQRLLPYFAKMSLRDRNTYLALAATIARRKKETA